MEPGAREGRGAVVEGCQKFVTRHLCHNVLMTKDNARFVCILIIMI